jgi:hypothetical protein
MDVVEFAQKYLAGGAAESGAAEVIMMLLER